MTDRLSSDVLTKLRDFCRQYFCGRLSNRQKAELSEKLNEYVLTVCGQLCHRLSTEVLDMEPNVMAVNSPCFVFGDIHGNLQDVYDMETDIYRKTDHSHILLGDYVDRGPFSVEVCLYLFALKLIEPKKLILIRGNHEVRNLNRAFTFYTECVGKFGPANGHNIWDQINCCFDRLPFAATIDSDVFCCHGGVPKSIHTIAEMLAIRKPIIDPGQESQGVHELLWNDPVESMPTFNRLTERVLRHRRIRFIPNRDRNTGYYFTPLAAKQFLDRNGFTYMIRAHQCIDDGFNCTSEGRVMTVFSSSNYCGKNNTTCFIEVSNTDIQVWIFKVSGVKPSHIK